MVEPGVYLCDAAGLEEGDSRGFSVRVGAGFRDVFLVRREGALFAYANSCPHTGGPLDWVPDRFLNLEGDLIQCATHDALFTIEEGTCVAGPCAGKSLTPVAVEIRAGGVYLLPGDAAGR